MFEERETHQAFMGAAAVLCVVGIALITGSFFWMYAQTDSYYVPVFGGMSGTVLFLCGLGVAQYVKWRMR